MTLPTACPKPLPRIADKKAAKRQKASTQREVYRLVDQRDKRLCRVCWAKEGLEHHHRIPRSRGGPTSAENVLLACTLCHKLMQQYRILVEGPTCNDPLTFAMSPQIAALVFTGRTVPPQVRIETLARD